MVFIKSKLKAKYLTKKTATKVDDLLALSPLNSTRGHRFKVFVPRSRLEVRKRFFSCRVVSQWNNLSPDTVSSGSLEQFKSRLAADLGDKLFEIP